MEYVAEVVSAVGIYEGRGLVQIVSALSLFERVRPKVDTLPILGVPGFVALGRSHLLAGLAKGGGKTELLWAAVQEWIAAGHSVLWVTEEEEDEWAERIQRRGQVPGIERLSFIFGYDHTPESLIEKLRWMPEEVVVIVDTIRNLMNIEEENNASKVLAAFKPWDSALRNRTRIYVHHARKAQEWQPAGGGQGIAGSGAFPGAVSRIIELGYRGGDKRQITMIARNCAKPPKVLYELQEKGFVVLSVGDTVEGPRVPKGAPAAVLGVLNGDLRKTSEVQALLPKLSVSAVLKALNTLRGAGLALRDPEGDRERATYRWRKA